MRQELHLKVADSIEKVFNERLHEFYGMLAYHFSKGENLDKAEKYMIKAGENALSSSASHEALRYYREALDLYVPMGIKLNPLHNADRVEEGFQWAFHRNRRI